MLKRVTHILVGTHDPREGLWPIKNEIFCSVKIIYENAPIFYRKIRKDLSTIIIGDFQNNS